MPRLYIKVYFHQSKRKKCKYFHHFWSCFRYCFLQKKNLHFSVDKSKTTIHTKISIFNIIYNKKMNIWNHFNWYNSFQVKKFKGNLYLTWFFCFEQRSLKETNNNESRINSHNRTQQISWTWHFINAEARINKTLSLVKIKFVIWARNKEKVLQ